MQFQLRADDDDRAARIVDALSEQVLTEATALALDHVGERLQRTLVGARHRLAATAVVEQRIDRFLQHALLVAHDDLRRFQFKQTLQPVVAVDHAAIQIVQIRCRKATTIERHQRTQLGRKHRKHFENHPLRLDARALKAFEHFQPLRELLDLRFRTGFRQILAQRLDFFVDVDAAQQLANRFGAH